MFAIPLTVALFLLAFVVLVVAISEYVVAVRASRRTQRPSIPARRVKVRQCNRYFGPR